MWFLLIVCSEKTVESISTEEWWIISHLRLNTSNTYEFVEDCEAVRVSIKSKIKIKIKIKMILNWSPLVKTGR